MATLARFTHDSLKTSTPRPLYGPAPGGTVTPPLGAVELAK
jgi:hypothetical protein